MMLKKKIDHLTHDDHPWSVKLGIKGRVRNEVTGVIETYHVANVPFGLLVMFFAGILSALLGIGSGVFKVLAMDGAMKLPMKVSSATSNFMIGVTASASAGAYFLRGDIKPEIAAPVSVGIIIGSFIGGKVMPRMPAKIIRRLFVIVLVIVAVQMIQKGLSL
jgi:uncharacterized protein